MIKFSISFQPKTESTLAIAVFQACQEQDSTFTKAQVKALLLKGGVWLQSAKASVPVRTRRAKKNLLKSDTVYIYYDQRVLNSSTLPPQNLYDFGDYSVWYKPKGMLCQGSKWSDHTVINRWIEMQHQKPCWIVHRLDRATDGLILIGHNKKTTAQLASLFEQKKVLKTYRASVTGNFPYETKTLTSPVAGKSAISHINKIQFHKDLQVTELEITIETGRKHQIRTHLAEIGFPIIGDRLFNSDNLSVDLQLTAIRIELMSDISHFQQKFVFPKEFTPPQSLMLD